jgi:hypothetical protein
VAALVRSLRPAHFPAVPAPLLASSFMPRAVAAALSGGGAGGSGSASGGGGGGSGSGESSGLLLDDEVRAALLSQLLLLEERDDSNSDHSGGDGSSDGDGESPSPEVVVEGIEKELRSVWIADDLESPALLGADAAIRSASPVMDADAEEAEGGVPSMGMGGGGEGGGSMMESLDAALLVAEPLCSRDASLADLWPFEGSFEGRSGAAATTTRRGKDRAARKAICRILAPLAADDGDK